MLDQVLFYTEGVNYDVKNKFAVINVIITTRTIHATI